METAESLRGRLLSLLGAAEEGRAGGAGAGAGAAAERLWGRVRQFLAMGIVAGELDREAMELACYALCLPVPARVRGRAAHERMTLRQRVEHATEAMLSALEGAEPEMLDRVAHVLAEVPQRGPRAVEARLLADALGLEDFGIEGLVLHAMALGRQGADVEQFASSCRQRLEYGWWEARLAGFHFEPVRRLARQRLERAAAVLEMLESERKAEQPR